MGTLLLALTLAAYALAMTMGRGRFSPLNMALLLAAVFGAGRFGSLNESHFTSDPIGEVPRSGAERSLVMSALVSTVLMATLVVEPFYLS